LGSQTSFSLSKFYSDLGGSQVHDRGTNNEFIGGLKGTFDVGSRNWNWDVSYQTGRSTYRRDLLNNVNQVNLYNATDTVTVTAANRGASGLPIGSVACRTSLAAPTNGCVPINPFIPLSQNSAQALDYVLFHAWFEQVIKQQSVEANLSGDLFDGWAGPISFATGGEYRKISTDVTSDPLSQVMPADYIAATAAGIRGLPGSIANSANAGVGRFGNFQALSGSYNVKEAFVEVNVPLLNDVPLIKRAELNAAYRYTDYSTSGGVNTWKLGLVWDLTDQFRIRGTRSHDIRAPNVVELYSPPKQAGTTVNDPAMGNAAVITNRYDQGNPDLTPEIANTLTLGMVYRPNASSGLRASVDGYDIKIHNAIILLDAQTVVNGCAAGADAYCSLITRAGGVPTGAITGIDTSYFNGQSIQQRGVDFELSYGLPVERVFAGASGSLMLRGLVNYVDKYSLSQGQGLPDVDKAGEVGAPGSGSSTGVFGVPHWSGTADATYSNEHFTAFLQGRYVGGGKYDNTFNTDKYNAPGQPITYINDNHVGGRFYTDLTLKWDFGGTGRSYELAASVTNLFDVDPPIVPTRASAYPSQTNGLLYDTLGRRYTLTFRVKL
jgi:outer membrane receptor protein involved in Fe transport